MHPEKFAWPLGLSRRKKVGNIENSGQSCGARKTGFTEASIDDAERPLTAHRRMKIFSS
jgi:hypothetical protein